MSHCTRNSPRRRLALAASALLTFVATTAAGQQPDFTNVFRRGEGSYHTYRIPAVIAAANGDLVAFCEGRVNGPGDAGDIDLLCRRSHDNGQTWGATQLIWNDADNTCGNPCPVVDRSTGVIHLLLTHNSGSDTEPEIIAGRARWPRTVWYASSSDHGATWTPPVEITSAVKRPEWTWYATGPGAGVQIEHGPHAGRLVIPCDHDDRAAKRYSHVFYSDDHGQNWQLGGAAPKVGVNECEVVELADGALLLNMRNYDRSTPARQRATSLDGGATWGDQRHDAALVEPVCQASIRRIRWPDKAAASPGAIAFSNPADPKKRRNMTVRLSEDDGLTWPHAAQLYPGSSAYSCLVALPDGSIGCLFEADDYERIVFARFSLNWLTSAASAKPPRFEIQAHRGAGIARPENTLECFEWAWSLGVTPEADLRTTKDGVIVCFHDADLTRVVSNIEPQLKKSSIEKLPLAEVQKLDVGSFRGQQYAGQRVPTLASVLTHMREHPERLLYLDVKTADVDQLAALVKSRGVERQVVFTTTHHHLIRDWKKRVPESLTLLWNGGTEEELAKKLTAVRQADYEGVTHLQIHVHVGDLESPEPFNPTSAFLRTVHKALQARGIVFQVLPWECSDARAYEKLLALGAESFATDYPEVTAKAVQDFRAHQTPQ